MYIQGKYISIRSVSPGTNTLDSFKLFQQNNNTNYAISVKKIEKNFDYLNWSNPRWF